MTERTWLPKAAQATLALLLFVLIPLAFRLPGPNVHNLPELIAWTLTLTSGACIMWLAVSRRPRIVELSFWLFVYVFFGVAAIAQISAHRYPLAVADYSSSQLLTTQLRIIIGIAAFVAGTILWRLPSPRRRLAERWEGLEVSERRLQVIGAVGAVIAILLIAKTGLKSFFESRDALSVALYNAAGKVQGVQVYNLASKTAGGVKQFFLNVPVLVVLFYLLATGLWRRHRLLTVVLIVVNIVTNNFISQARWWTGVVVVGLLAAVVDLSKHRRHTYVVLGLLLTTVFGLSYLGIFRATASEGGVSRPPRSQQLVASADYGMFQQELNGTVYVETHGFTGGRQIAGAVLVFVPHKIWPSKPGATGQLTEQVVGLNVLDSASLWTELYIDFGYPELLIGFLLLGIAFAYLDDIFERSESIAARVIVPVVATYAILFLRGSLQPSLAFGVPIFVLLILCLKRRQPGDGRATEGANLRTLQGVDSRGGTILRDRLGGNGSLRPLIDAASIKAPTVVRSPAATPLGLRARTDERRSPRVLRSARVPRALGQRVPRTGAASDDP